MRNRVYLGALYYYFWSIPFFFSAAPVSAYYFAGLLGVVATALTFEVGRRVAGAPAGVASALVFATMPLAVLDGRMAWAPAALPVVCAAMLLAVVVLLERGSLVSALAVAAFAAVAVQLHVAAAPLVLVAAVVILSQAARLGGRGVVAAGLTGIVVSLPTAWALTVPTPVAAVPVAAADDVTAGRVADVFRVGSRALSGLSPEPATWPGWVRWWVGGEVVWVGVVAACAVVLLFRLPAVRRPGGLAAIVGTLALSWLAVVFLPWEAWYYYLDVGLVPAALVVGAVVATVLGPTGWWVLLGVAAGRAALVLWWVHSAYVSGVVGANLDLLRVGGPRPAYADARARIPTVGTRRAASETLVADLGFRPPSLWRRARGPGFSDLDTDNGYFFARAATDAPGTSTGKAGDVLVTYRGQVPADWRSEEGAPIISGPFEIFRYEPALEHGRARLLGCGGGSVPTRPATTPLDYGDGSLKRAEWPCADPVVSVPLRPEPGDGTIRVFARLDGPGRIVRLDVEPPSTARPIADPPPGLGQGIEVLGGATNVIVELSLVGPASLDLFELRGR